MMAILILFIIQWYGVLFCQTFFQHRYAAHNMFSMSKSWERFFFVLTFLLQGSSYLSPKVYAILHRLHHAYTDTENDPHSPKYCKSIFTMMWNTRIQYNKLLRNEVYIEEKFKKNLPQWDSFDRFGNSKLVRACWGFLYIFLYIKLANYWWLYLLLPIQIIMTLFQGTIINWFAHKHGYTNFKLNNWSKNLLLIDILMLGESYHNNHHRFPRKLNFGFRWHEVDITFQICRVLNYLQIIQFKSRLSKKN